MKKIINPFVFIATLLAMFCLNQAFLNAQCGQRYLSQVFDEVEVTKDIMFGNAINFEDEDQDLFLDVYEPAGDLMEKRPVIILAFGGAFIAGTKESGDIVYLCNEFAKRGFVAVSMQYRISDAGSLFIQGEMVKAVMRAVQDGRGAIGYMRQDAATDNDFRIDPDQIFIGGASAGALLAMHVAYMNADDSEDMPEEWLGYVEELGGWESHSGPEGYSDDVNGVISMAGALGFVEFMDEGDEPIVSFHSTADGTVPFEEGSPLGIDLLPTIYGSSGVHARADELGIDNQLHIYEDGNHPPYLNGVTFLYEVLDTIVNCSSNFIYNYIECPEAEILDTQTETTTMSDTTVSETSSYNIITNTVFEETCTGGVFANIDTVVVCEIDTMIAVDSIAWNTDLPTLAEAAFAKVYPNPAKDFLVVEMSSNNVNSVAWKLYAPNGKLLRSGQNTQANQYIKIDRQGLMTGLYYLQLESDGKMAVQKVVFE